MSKKGNLILFEGRTKIGMSLSGAIFAYLSYLDSQKDIVFITVEKVSQ